jgi:hypothetical protein
MRGYASGSDAEDGARSIASRYERIAETGREYSEPRRDTEYAWLTPSPSRNRPGYASVSIRQPLAVAIASRAQMLAIPLAITARWVEQSSHPAWVKTSRLSTASGNQSAP